MLAKPRSIQVPLFCRGIISTRPSESYYYTFPGKHLHFLVCFNIKSKFEFKLKIYESQKKLNVIRLFDLKKNRGINSVCLGFLIRVWLLLPQILLKPAPNVRILAHHITLSTIEKMWFVVSYIYILICCIKKLIAQYY